MKTKFKVFNALFDDVYRTYFPVVHRYLLFHTHSAELAQELAQEVFLDFCRSPDVAIASGKLESWLIRVAHNRHMDYQLSRKKKKMDRIVVSLEDEEISSYVETLVYEDRDDWLFLHKSLSEKDTEILLLFYREGYSTREIAQKTGISETYCRKRLERARKKIKNIYLTSVTN